MRDHDEIDYLRMVERKFYDRGKRLEKTGIPERYWDLTFGELEDFPRPLAPMASMVSTFVDDVIAAPDREWQRVPAPFLSGPPGIGKTLLACVAGIALSDAGFCVRYVRWAAYIDAITQRVGLSKLAAHDEGGKYFDDLKLTYALEDDVRNTAHFLIADDVGKEHKTASGYAGYQFDLVLRERYDRGLLTLLTTNVSVASWDDEYSASMRSFVYETSQSVQLDLSGMQPIDYDHRLRHAKR
jgi:hypothetical protein